MYTREDFFIYLIRESIYIFSFIKEEKKEKESEFFSIEENLLRLSVEKSSWTKNASALLLFYRLDTFCLGFSVYESLSIHPIYPIYRLYFLLPVYSRYSLLT